VSPGLKKIICGHVDGIMGHLGKRSFWFAISNESMTNTPQFLSLVDVPGKVAGAQGFGGGC